MSRFFGYLVTGLANGTIYALVALGVVITYRVSRVINLAAGSIGVLSAFVFHYLLMADLGLPVAVATIGAIATGAALGASTERYLVRPVRSRGALATLTVTTGVLLLLSELTVQVWGPDTPVIASVFSDRVIRVGNTGLTVHQIATAGLVLLLVGGLYLLLARTWLGSGVTAIAQDPGAARIVGLPVNSIITFTWAIGGASAALAGLMYIHLNSLDQISLTFVLISSLVAAALGGFNSLPLAGAGGLAVGLIFSFSQGYVNTAGIGELLVFLALLAVLVVRAGKPQLDVVAEF
ncbi:MAG TPA: branched-chain amino acid ABC transporter permease [Sporichthyaceae bacterium]|jgi:branched-subunit amino acid ABC-type transport system permease component|nr:branched-chain amino acid ABC transporter permease [Sporichthyaceae bacterium]